MKIESVHKSDAQAVARESGKRGLEQNHAVNSRLFVPMAFNAPNLSRFSNMNV